MADLDLEEVLRHHGWGDTVDAFKRVGTIVGYVADVFSAYGTALKLLQFVGALPGGRSDLEVAMNAIVALGDAILGALRDVELAIIESTMELKGDVLETELAKVRAAMKEIMREDLTDTEAENARSQTSEAIEYLRMNNRWRHKYHEDLAYKDAWVGTVVPPAAPPILGGWSPEVDGNQWNHAFALAPFLEAVLARVVVAVATDAQEFDSYRAEIGALRDKLRAVWHTMRDGIRELPPPSLEDTVFRYRPSPEGVGEMRWTVQVSRWEETAPTLGEGGLYGVYDVWSGRFSVHAYPYTPPRPAVGSQVPTRAPSGLLNNVWLREWRENIQGWYEDEVRALHALRSLNRWKSLYAQLGLEEVWRVSAKLAALLGESAGEPPGRTGSWSLREAIDTIPPDLRPPYSLRMVALFANVTPAASAIRAL